METTTFLRYKVPFLALIPLGLAALLIGLVQTKPGPQSVAGTATSVRAIPESQQPRIRPVPGAHAGSRFLRAAGRECPLLDEQRVGTSMRAMPEFRHSTGVSECDERTPSAVVARTPFSFSLSEEQLAADSREEELVYQAQTRFAAELNSLHESDPSSAEYTEQWRRSAASHDDYLRLQLGGPAYFQLTAAAAQAEQAARERNALPDSRGRELPPQQTRE